MNKVGLQLSGAETRIHFLIHDVIVRPLSTVGYTSVVASVIHSIDSGLTIIIQDRCSVK